MSNNYQKTAEEVAQKLQKYYHDTDWESVDQKKRCTIYSKKSEEYHGKLYKGEAVINAKPKVVFDYIDPLPDGKRQKWDKAMKKIETIKQIDDKIRINRACTSSACMGLISPRDFIDLIFIKETDDYISTNAMSVENEFEEQTKFVRGWNYACGILVCKNQFEPNKCKLVSLIQPDIKGMLPVKLVESAIPGSMVEFFDNLHKALKEDGELIDED